MPQGLEALVHSPWTWLAVIAATLVSMVGLLLRLRPRPVQRASGGAAPPAKQ